MSLLDNDEKFGICYTKLISKKLDFTKPLENALVKNDAYEIRVFGDTPRTKAASDCGNEAIADISPYPGPNPLLPDYINIPYFGVFLNKLKKMGYKTGLTLQSLPFDWGLSVKNNGLNQKFKSTLVRLNKLSNKKVVIIAHSYGNVNTQYQLSRMTLAEKQKLIKNWVALAYPSIGGGQVIGGIIAGNPSYPIPNNLNVVSSIANYALSCGTQELRSPDYNEMFKNQEWFKKFLKRVDYENGSATFEETDFPWLPKLTDNCFPNQYSFGTSCALGIYDSSAIPIVKINNKEYHQGQMRDVFNEWPTNSEAIKFFDLIDSDKLYTLDNPEVPVIAIGLRSIPTIEYVTIEEDIFAAIAQNRFPGMTFNKKGGDDSVSVNSLLLAPLKWGYEFDNNVVPNAKPVKIVDYCSLYNQRLTPYDGQNASGESIIKKNEFIGLDCDCISSPDSSLCGHDGMVLENHMLKFLKTILKTNEVGCDQNFEKRIRALRNDYLTDIADRCVQLDSDANFTEEH